MLTGRKKILTRAKTITASNVVAVLKRAEHSHYQNQSDIDYLLNYYRGIQPILYREKEIREEICNYIVENHADEIVTFKTGYLVGEPVVYTTRTGGDAAERESDTENIKRLNEIMLCSNKATADYELVEWFEICGTSYRMVLPNPEDKNAPLSISTLDPRYTFVVYSADVFQKPIMAVTCINDDLEDTTVYACYTNDMYFEIKNDKVVRTYPHTLGAIPIIEYPANSSRMGSFEQVIPLLDAINTVESNRVDGIEQFIQALMVLTNVEIDSEEFAKMRELGAIQISSTEGQKATVEILTSELSQGETQTLVDHLYRTVMLIVGMPINQGGGASTSDTGVAVMMRDGWSLAETRAKAEELMFKQSEQRFLTVVLQIINITDGTEIDPSKLEIKFTRRNYEAIQSKAQVLTTMLGTGQVHPKLAHIYCGMFNDPEEAYAMSKAYVEEQQNNVDHSLNMTETINGSDPDRVTNGNAEPNSDNKVQR